LVRRIGNSPRGLEPQPEHERVSPVAVWANDVLKIGLEDCPGQDFGPVGKLDGRLRRLAGHPAAEDQVGHAKPQYIGIPAAKPAVICQAAADVLVCLVAVFRRPTVLEEGSEPLRIVRVGTILFEEDLLSLAVYAAIASQRDIGPGGRVVELTAGSRAATQTSCRGGPNHHRLGKRGYLEWLRNDRLNPDNQRIRYKTMWG